MEGVVGGVDRESQAPGEAGGYAPPPVDGMRRPGSQPQSCPGGGQHRKGEQEAEGATAVEAEGVGCKSEDGRRDARQSPTEVGPRVRRLVAERELQGDETEEEPAVVRQPRAGLTPDCRRGGCTTAPSRATDRRSGRRSRSTR